MVISQSKIESDTTSEIQTLEKDDIATTSTYLGPLLHLRWNFQQ